MTPEQVKADLRAFYDREARRLSAGLAPVVSVSRNPYTDISPALDRFRRRKVSTALRLAEYECGANILEIGTGLGQYAVALASLGFHVMAVDLSPRIVEVAAAYAKRLEIARVQFREADAENLEIFTDRSFDGVVSFSTFRYVPNLLEALSEVRRVTRPGGRVVLDFPNRYCPWFRVLKNHFGVPDHIHDRVFAARTLIRTMEEAGFVEVRVKKILFTHYSFPPRFARLYDAIDAVCERLPLVRECAAILMCSATAP